MVRFRAKRGYWVPDIIGAVVLILMLGLIGIVLVFRGEGDTAEAEALKFLSVEIPDELPVQSGKTLHVQEEIYFRYGPKAELITAYPGVGPEETLHESWTEIGPNETVLNRYAVISTHSGVVVQESLRTEEIARIEDPRTSTILEESVPAVLARANAPKERALLLAADIQAGDAEVVSQTGDLLILEYRRDVSGDDPLLRSAEGDADFTTPYVTDLHPVQMVKTVAIRNDGVIAWSEVEAISATGLSTVVQYQRLTTYEVLDQFPFVLE